ncbi:TMhelix containing protein [Vibrio phage 1.049.O._10N.286.54.B5]|nr:TMhelix containing protein [Vibrio phage 1.049.O._10N.286.54.B5]AUR84222.1 TMhelix containing protein [Vibrio phage 1.050.O._10N.286.48.A6]AUR84439.1 TMhelix containing protein [Vibrio phage 1.055.O._10N.286.55.E9]
MLILIKKALFVITAFSLLAFAYGWGIKDIDLMLSSLQVCLPTSIFLSLLIYVSL